MNDFLSRLAPAVALCLPLLAHAQVGRPDPANPETSAPAMPGHGGHPKHGGKQ